MISDFHRNVMGGALMSTGFFDPMVDPSGGMRMSVDYGKGANVHMSALDGNLSRNLLSSGTVNAGFGSMGKLGIGMASAGAIFGPGVALIAEGPQAALQAAAYDIGTNAALLAHHYQPAMAAGNVTSKGLIAPGLLTGAGEGISRLSRLRNTMGFLGKGVIGGGVGGVVGGMAGGAAGEWAFGGYGRFVGSVAGSFAGSYLGTSAMAAAIANPITTMGIAGLAVGGAAVVGSAAAVGYGTYSTLKAGYRHRQMQKSIHTSGSLAAFHTQGAQTMRQRAVQAIHKSHLNSRSALGQEASLLHTNKNYHSNYRRYY